MARTLLLLAIILSLIVGSLSSTQLFQLLGRNQSQTVSSKTSKKLTLGNSKVTLRSLDGGVYSVDQAVAIQSKTIKHILENDQKSHEGILLPNITSLAIEKAIEYCKKHVDDSKNDDLEIKKWDLEIVSKVDHCTLYGLVVAGNELQISGLYELATKTIESMIIGKTEKQIRKIFNIISSMEPGENIVWGRRA